MTENQIVLPPALPCTVGDLGETMLKRREEFPKLM
jgi:hypothetical protein